MMVYVRNIYARVQGGFHATPPTYMYVFWSGREHSDMTHGAVDLVSRVTEMRADDFSDTSLPRTTVYIFWSSPGGEQHCY